jgi:anti-sigma regulatory factor (Ser/Thr protein kinase)/CheY-like chemotaxis protein
MYRVLVIGEGCEAQEWVKRTAALPERIVEPVAGRIEALRRLRERAFDVVVTSPCTSLGEDLALVEEMRRLRPAIRVIVLAPRLTPEDVIAALRARVFAVFTAPVEPLEVTDMVRRAVEDRDWRSGIDVVTARRDWISVRADCRLLTAERLVTFMNELASEVTSPERYDLMLAFREILVNAMEHGAGFDPEKLVEVSAVRTERALVFYVRDPGPGFRPRDLAHAAVSNPPGDPLAHVEKRAKEGLRPGGFGILLARKIVDELIYNELGNEVLLVKHMR